MGLSPSLNASNPWAFLCARPVSVVPRALSFSLAVGGRPFAVLLRCHPGQSNAIQANPSQSKRVHSCDDLTVQRFSASSLSVFSEYSVVALSASRPIQADQRQSNQNFSFQFSAFRFSTDRLASSSFCHSAFRSPKKRPSQHKTAQFWVCPVFPAFQYSVVSPGESKPIQPGRRQSHGQISDIFPNQTGAEYVLRIER